MFKDFGRRLQRDIKRRADARMDANRRITMAVSNYRDACSVGLAGMAWVVRKASKLIKILASF